MLKIVMLLRFMKYYIVKESKNDFWIVIERFLKTNIKENKKEFIKIIYIKKERMR